jgi:hypothetical protein
MTNVISFRGNRKTTSIPTSPRSVATRKQPTKTINDIKLELRFRKLAKQLKRARGNSNIADIRTLREFLSLTMELIPLAKATYNEYRSDRSIYALNGLVNQARELMNDIRQLRTGKKQHTYIINRIIMPNLQLLLQNYLNDSTELKNKLSKLNSKDRRNIQDTVDATMRAHAIFFNEIGQKIQTVLAEYMIG